LKDLVKKQITFLLYGIGFWLPIALLIFILIFLFNKLEVVGRQILSLFIPENFLYTGLGILFCILIVYLSGIALKSTNIKRLVSKIPVLSLFFGAGEMISIEQLLHLNPCIFLFSPTCLSYGWILSEEKVKLDNKDALYTLVNVYYPNVPSIITGQVFPVRKASAIKLGNSSKEIIDLLLYAFRSPEHLKYLPWEGESWEDLEKRAQSFGLTIQVNAGGEENM
jgi:hypothetical protein